MYIKKAQSLSIRLDYRPARLMRKSVGHALFSRRSRCRKSWVHEFKSGNLLTSSSTLLPNTRNAARPVLGSMRCSITRTCGTMGMFLSISSQALLQSLAVQSIVTVCGDSLSIMSRGFPGRQIFDSSPQHMETRFGHDYVIATRPHASATVNLLFSANTSDAVMI